jgi:hypothetical protein
MQEAVLDLKTFIENMADSGVGQARTEQLLLQDLEEGGPIFGKFTRSLSGAVSSSVAAAGRQGEVAGAMSASAARQRFLNLAQPGEAIQAARDMADPEALGEIEQAASGIMMTWVCALEKTCHMCLPLHGSRALLGEWRERGLHPDSIHSNAGWVSKCFCSLVPTDEAEPRKDLNAPLVRMKNKSATGLKVSKKTSRSIVQTDIDKALAAKEKAMNSLEGRRTLRLMGQSDA